MLEGKKKIATRESYGNALVELGKINDQVVVLDADLAGATKTGTFNESLSLSLMALVASFSYAVNA